MSEMSVKMQKVSESKADRFSQPVMNRHRPTSEKTQDISHLLARTFKDLYTKEVIGKSTTSNLIKSRRRDDSYHDKYVEELKQVRSEYNKRISNADMLASHIIQAQLQASAKEELAHTKLIEDVGVDGLQFGIAPVKSTLMWCIDNSLLKSNNLICCQDYMKKPAPQVRAPRGKHTPGYIEPTFSFNMRVSREPQDDGYTLIPAPTPVLLEGSEKSLTLSSSTPGTRSVRSAPLKAQQTHKSPGMAAKSREEAKAAQQKLDKPLNFLRNPHFETLSDRRGGKSLIVSAKTAVGEKSCPEAPVPMFVAKPPVVLFSDYRVGEVYEVTVKLRNMTAASHHVRVIPPTTPHFSISLGRFPGDGGMVAPGMSCQYTVRFSPDSLADYEDFLVVETHSPYPLIIPLEAHRSPPILTLPAVVDLGCCLVGGVMVVKLVCHNVGESAGTFCILPKSQRLTSNFRSVVKSSFAEQPPFAISPSLFQLLPGQAVLLEALFFPTLAEICSQTFTIVCDNCQVKDFTIQGTGQHVAIELVELEGGEQLPKKGEERDRTADHFVRFESANPNSVLQKKLVIRNNTHLELPFDWQIIIPNLQTLALQEISDVFCIQHHVAVDNIFSVSPASGLLAPAQDHEFLLTYHPQELTDYHRVCHLIIRDVPDVKKVNESVSLRSEPVYRVGDVSVMEVDVKGSTESYRVLLDPPLIVIENETYIHTSLRKHFQMWNHSKSKIRFKWKRISDCHIIEVEPSSGEIGINKYLDMNLILTGSQPGVFNTILPCHVQDHHSPVNLPIKVTFIGPCLTVNTPNVDLGLLKLGQEACHHLQITNRSPLEASWFLEQVPGDSRVSQGQINWAPSPTLQQVKGEPIRGVLPPLASCSVDVLFKAVCCGNFESVLQLSVINGKGCYLPVRAIVGCPRVCLLGSELDLSDLYVGIEKKVKVTVLNQTQLPVHFTWTKLKGRQARLCSASFTPSSGTLRPKERMEIGVSFTTYTDEELTDVRAFCEGDGMEEPVVLNFPCKAQGLSVSFSLPTDDSGESEVCDEQPVLLDFSSDEPVLVGKSATRKLLLTNHTQIPAPFTVEVAVFTGGNGECLLQSQPSTNVRMPLHEMQANKIQEKQHKDFISRLLAHGKGAAFYVEPDRGTLGPFETVVINVTAYNDMWGDYQDRLFCKVGDLDPTFIPMRLSVQGCPIYFQMIGPQPDNQNQGPMIRFGTHTSGGDTVSQPLYLKNSSPYDIRMDWLTYNKDPEDKQLIDLIVSYGEHFPLKDADGNEVIGGLSSSFEAPPTEKQSHSPSSDRTSSSSLGTNREDSEKELSDEEENESSVSTSPIKKLFNVLIQPHEGSVADYPYCITPQQILVPAKGSSTIHVSFTPPTLSAPTSDTICVGYALGFMSLDSKASTGLLGDVFWAEGYNLEPLRLDLQAFVEAARLSVELEDDIQILEFSTAASDLLDGDTLKQESLVVRDLPLRNTGNTPLSFRLSAQPPFSVLQPVHQQRHTASSSSQSLRHGESATPGQSLPPKLQLKPKMCMQVKVAFHLSAFFLTSHSQSEVEVLSSTTLPGSDGEQRDMSFSGNLNIQYSNNTVQTIPLCARLALPLLYISRTSIDFGTCYVGVTKTEKVHLFNSGASSSLWMAFTVEDEGSDVFTVTPDQGLLKPLVYPVSSCRQRLKISFTACDQRLFQGRVTVQGILAEPPLTLELRGIGSFDEKHIVDR